MLHVASLVRTHRRAGIVIDTNLLLLLLIGDLRTDLVEHFKPTKSHFVAEDYDRLTHILRPMPPIVTTPYIFAEVSNFADRLSEPEKTAAFRRLADLSRFDVHDIPLATVVNEPAFRVLGTTDAGIVHLARQGMLVFTIDAPLSAYISNMGFECVNYNNINVASDP